MASSRMSRARFERGFRPQIPTCHGWGAVALRLLLFSIFLLEDHLGMEFGGPLIHHWVDVVGRTVWE